MGKVYTKQTWTDEVLEGEERFLIEDDDDLTVYEQAKITLATGVTTEGTPVSAARMNTIEDGIDDLDDKVDGLDTGTVKHSLASAANDFLVASGVGAFVKKTLAETLTILGKAAASGLASLDGSSKVVQDPANATATPTASKIPIADGSGKLNGWISAFESEIAMGQYSLLLPSGEPTSNDTGVGIKDTVTVDTNSVGICALLCLASDGHYDEADADAIATCKGLVLALETGTGSKKILRMGKFRHDDWDFTAGSILYASTTAGGITAIAPSGVDDVITPIGHALTDDMIYFNPSDFYITHTG